MTNVTDALAGACHRYQTDRLPPVVFVTHRDAEEDVVHALQEGADDFLSKPVRRLELLARVNALWRRMQPGADDSPLDVPPYRIDAAQHRISIHGTPVELTQKEYDLALFLFRNVGRLLSRGHLLESVWGRAAVDSRTLDTHISRLRVKLELRPESGFRLSPVYGYGYRLESVGKPVTP